MSVGFNCYIYSGTSIKTTDRVKEMLTNCYIYSDTNIKTTERMNGKAH